MGVERRLPACTAMRAPVLFALFALTSCTIAGGTVGGLSASSSNRAAREAGKPETASVGARVLLGALIGLAVDAYIVHESLEGCCPSFGTNER